MSEKVSVWWSSLKVSPMKKGSGFKSKQGLKRSPINQKSSKQKDREKKYLKLREEYMASHPTCEYPGCKTKSKDIHHKARRTGNNLYRHFMAVCRRHHDYIESHPKESRERGFLIKDDPRR